MRQKTPFQDKKLKKIWWGARPIALGQVTPWVSVSADATLRSFCAARTMEANSSETELILTVRCGLMCFRDDSAKYGVQPT